ncbi:transcriptional regulator [Burkholderia diffusa]|uniref:Transcriptional regulator n=1 Tax=Burkholderia diffusa TaxID=488732 RepID=A0AAW3P9A2_9BURK|nr:winged helix-turn-helix domain-containing protein [Burkholderia diffusa]KWF41470.1 transcriptional regulator [Burkholderia diffusa]KWF44295.1 transcriptional regulator [Burkholderia diffusa]KWF45204.1 transcriptional regulator [Burkholderia diffusa]KWF51187.1 transcriptional regulator [Burkholderia diffusa]
MIQIGNLSVDFEQRDIRHHGASLRIGARALDILEVLHRANGSLVSKDDIMDAVWPGLIVEENRLQVHVATLRKALGPNRDLIKTVPGRGYLLIAHPPVAHTVAPPAADAAHDADAASHPVPLVGRQTEIGQIVDMLERAPVVTLVGAGGIGKTSLAGRVAHEWRARSGDRVVFVELACAATRDDVLRAIATELGLDVDGVPAVEQVGDALAATRGLLVLDNAEHVVDLVADLVETLTSHSATPRVLVTSREPLHISVETVFRVSPLAVPDRSASVDEIVRHSAVELFLARIRAATPDCAVDAAGLRLIGDICRRLDGLPLAIELAAARVATLGLEVVAARLDDRLNLLTGGLRSALPRHQTLRATFDWSYVLLDAAARSLFRRMACFIGPFTFDAARDVAMAPGMPAAEMVALLGELVAKSLVAVEFNGAQARYRLTESTRAYALEKLRNEGEFDAVAARHARYEREQAQARMLAQAERTHAAGLRSGADTAPLREFAAAGPQAAEIDGLAHALLEPARMRECSIPARRTLDALDAGAPGAVDAAREMRLRAAYAAALLHTDGDTHTAAAMWDRTLGLAGRLGDEAFDARALVGLWNAMLTRSDIHESLRYATRFERAAQRRGDRSQRLLANAMVATSLHYFGEHAQARERLEAATAELADAGEPPCAEAALGVDVATLGRTMLTRLVWMQGDPEYAMRLAAQAVDCARRGGSGLALCVVLGAAAVPIALRYGDHDVIADYLATLRATADANGFDIWRNHAECLAGQFDMQAGHPGAGLARLEPALRRIEASGFRRLLAPLVVAYAEGLTRTGRAADACTRLDATLARCRAHGEHLFVPELLRARGLATLEQARAADPDRAAACEADGQHYLLTAIHAANAQGAAMSALRSTLDLADHLIERGRTAQASSLVADLSAQVDPQSRAFDVRRLARLQNFVRLEISASTGLARARYEAAVAMQSAA